MILRVERLAARAHGSGPPSGPRARNPRISQANLVWARGERGARRAGTHKVIGCASCSGKGVRLQAGSAAAPTSGRIQALPPVQSQSRAHWATGQRSPAEILLLLLLLLLLLAVDRATNSMRRW